LACESGIETTEQRAEQLEFSGVEDQHIQPVPARPVMYVFYVNA
jgi:hypothetical protein